MSLNNLNINSQLDQFVFERLIMAINELLWARLCQVRVCCALPQPHIWIEMDEIEMDEIEMDEIELNAVRRSMIDNQQWSSPSLTDLFEFVLTNVI